MRDPIITCAPAPELLRECTTPMRVLRTVEAQDAQGAIALTLAQGVSCTFWGLANDSAAWVVLRTDPLVLVVPLDALGVDLTNIVGRLHIAHALGCRLGFPRRKGLITIAASGSLWFRDPVPRPMWTLTTWNRNYSRTFAPSTQGLSKVDEVPALGALDPEDHTPLADGSLVVDAQALGVVAGHYTPSEGG